MNYNNYDTFDIKEFLPKKKVKAEGPVSLFPNHFFGLVVGPPGSGKTTVLRLMLMIPKALYKKFDLVLFISPYDIEGLELKEDRLHNVLDIEWIIQTIEYFKTKKDVDEVLVYLDDMVSMVEKMKNDPLLIDLMFNRRKLVKDVTISIIMSAQKFTMIPSRYRSQANFITFFNMPNVDLETIYKEHARSPMIIFKPIIKRHFDADEHNFIHMLIKPYKLFLNFDKGI